MLQKPEARVTIDKFEIEHSHSLGLVDWVAGCVLLWVIWDKLPMLIYKIGEAWRGTAPTP